MLRFNPRQNRRQLTDTQFDPSVNRLRYMKAFLFKPFHPDHKTAILPLQQLHQFFIAVEEGEHMPRFRGMSDILLHRSGKTVEGFSQVYRSGTVVNPYRAADAEHNRALSRSDTSDSVVSSKPFATAISIPSTSNRIPELSLASKGLTSTSSNDSESPAPSRRVFCNTRIQRRVLS